MMCEHDANEDSHENQPLFCQWTHELGIKTL